MAFQTPSGAQLTYHQAMRATAIQIWQQKGPTETVSAHHLAQHLEVTDARYRLDQVQRASMEQAVGLDAIRPWMAGWIKEGFAAQSSPEMPWDIVIAGSAVLPVLANDEAAWQLILAVQ